MKLHALLIGLLGLLSLGSCNSGQAAEPEVEFDAARAWTHLETIVGFGKRGLGDDGLEETRAYIESELRKAGLSPVRESFESATPRHGTVRFANLYADLEAAADEDPAPPRMVILMTHFDAKDFDVPGAPQEGSFQGANDSGSGTAVLLELARVLKAAGPRPVTYRFLFLDGEEATEWNWRGLDNTYGSRHHVEQLAKAKATARVGAAVLLDMVGDKQLKLTDEDYSTPALRKIFNDSARAQGLSKHVGGPRKQIEDDHKPFLAAGIPAVDLIDFSYGPGNRYWHTERDVLENCSQESLDVIGRIVIGGLPALDEYARKPR